MEKMRPAPKIYTSRFNSVVAVNVSETLLKGKLLETISVREFKTEVELHILEKCNY